MEKSAPDRYAVCDSYIYFASVHWLYSMSWVSSTSKASSYRSPAPAACVSHHNGSLGADGQVGFCIAKVVSWSPSHRSWSKATTAQYAIQGTGLHKPWLPRAFVKNHSPCLASRQVLDTAPTSSGSHHHRSQSTHPSLWTPISPEPDPPCCTTSSGRLLLSPLHYPQTGHCFGSSNAPPSSESCPPWFDGEGRRNSGFVEVSSCLHTEPPQSWLLPKASQPAGSQRGRRCHCSEASCSSQ